MSISPWPWRFNQHGVYDLHGNLVTCGGRESDLEVIAKAPELAEENARLREQVANAEYFAEEAAAYEEDAARRETERDQARSQLKDALRQIDTTREQVQALEASVCAFNSFVQGTSV